MKIVQVISAIGVLAMTVALFNGFVNGNFTEDGSLILNNPWGIVSLVDLYVGFFLFAIWMVFREKSIVAAIIWVIAIMVLGFFTGALYVFYATLQSKQDWLKFFLGDRKEDILESYNNQEKSV